MNAMPFAPGFKVGAGELNAGIGDQVFRRGAHGCDEPAEELPDFLGSGLLCEDREAKRFAGIMIDNDCDPPAKRPTLGHGKRQPRNPKAGVGGYKREVDVPDVIGAFGGDDTTGGLHGLNGNWFRCRLGDRRFLTDAADS